MNWRYHAVQIRHFKRYSNSSQKIRYVEMHLFRSAVSMGEFFQQAQTTGVHQGGGGSSAKLWMAPFPPPLWPCAWQEILLVSTYVCDAVPSSRINLYSKIPIYPILQNTPPPPPPHWKLARTWYEFWLPPSTYPPGGFQGARMWRLISVSPRIPSCK